MNVGPSRLLNPCLKDSKLGSVRVSRPNWAANLIGELRVDRPSTEEVSAVSCVHPVSYSGRWCWEEPGA